MSALNGNQRNHWLKLALLGLLLSISVAAFGRVPDGFLGGMEVELTPEIAQRLVQYYDFEESFTQAATNLIGPMPMIGDTNEIRNLRRLVFSTYLDNPTNYNLLSDNDKQFLRDRYSRLVVRAGGSLSASPSIITNSSLGIILPNGSVRPLPTNTDDYNRAKMVWTRELTMEQQISMMEPSRVNLLALASLWHAYGGFQQGYAQPRLQYAVPLNGTSEMYRTLRRLEHVRDMSAIEFRHREPLDNPETLWNDIETFLRHAGILHSFSSDNIDDIVFVRRNSSLHYHLSRTRDFSPELIARLNFLFLLQDIGIGYNGNFDRTVRYRYLMNSNARGLLRRISSNRIEIRSHRGNLKGQYDWLVDLFSKSDVQAIQILNRMIRENFSQEALNKVLRGVYLADGGVPSGLDEIHIDESTDAARAMVFFALDLFPEREAEIRSQVPYVDMIVERFRGEFSSSAPICQSQFRSSRYNRHGD